MKSLYYLLALVLQASAIYTQVTTDSTKLEPEIVDCDLTCFEWMNGHWNSVVSSDSLLESWQISLSEETYGHLSRIVGSDTIKLEQRLFQWKEGEMFLRVASADSSTATLKLVNTRNMTFTFINTDTGFPAKIIFEYVGPDTLRTVQEGTLDGKSQMVERRFVFFRMQKIPEKSGR